MEIPFVGQSYLHRSLPLSAQVCRNWFPEINPQTKRLVTLQPTMGAKAWSTGTSTDIDRGMVVFNDHLYKVSATTLYRIYASGVQASIGTILGSERCEFATDGTTLVIVCEGRVYSYDETTLTLENDADFESPTSVAYMNQQAIYNGDAQRFCVSDAGDLTSISTDNYATAESSGDSLVKVFTFNQTAYLMGGETIETWWNSGVGNPPFDRLEGGILQVGLGAKDSVATTSHAMYFLGSDRLIYALTGVSAVPITNPAIARAIEGYSRVYDAIGFTYLHAGHRFYQITFPHVDKTWVYCEDGQFWFEVSSGLEGGAHFATSYVFWRNRHLVASGGDVHEWDEDTYDEVGDPIRRERVCGPLDGQAFGLGDVAISMSKLEILLEAGVGLTEGQGVDPQIMLQFSDDGGRTWSDELWRSAGVLGAYKWRVRWDQLGQFRSRIFRLAATDPVKWVVYAADADLEAGIG